MKKTRLALLAIAIFALLSTLTGTATATPVGTAGTAGTAGPAGTAAACTAIGQAPNTVARFSLYAGTYYNGSCVTFYGYGSCSAGYSDNEGLYDLRSYGWSDRAASLWTYNSCDIRLYDLWNCPSRGAQTGWYDRTVDLGTWQNKASCVLVS